MTLMATDSLGNPCTIFWGEIAPCEHLLQLYEDEAAFLDALEGFVVGGLRAGEGVVVIATATHRAAMAGRLRAAGIDPDAVVDQYVELDAEEMLARFMVDGWPDEYLFDAAVSALLLRAGRGGRRVRAFGEMVALLWSQGHGGATVRLEHLWHRMCRERAFSLFCAYPRIGFTRDAASAIREICEAHTKVLHG